MLAYARWLKSPDFEEQPSPLHAGHWRVTTGGLVVEQNLLRSLILVALSVLLLVSRSRSLVAFLLTTGYQP